MIVPTISALLLLGQLASAVPFSQVARGLPKDISHVALDEDNGQYLAYKNDGTLYGKYPVDVARDVDHEYKRDNGASCSKLKVEEVKQLPGYKLLEEYADNTWGKGSRNVVTNPDKADQRGREATACVSNDVAQVELSGTPICNKQKGQDNSNANGTKGTIEAMVQQGTSNTAQWTVTSGSSIGVSAKVSAQIGIPEVASVTTELTTSAEFTNEVANGFSTTSGSIVSHKATFEVQDGKQCHVEWVITSCNVSGRGRIRYLASGWVWFEYDDKVQDHYKWAVNIENTITNQDDRSSFLEFTGSITGESASNSSSVCV